MFRYIWLLLFVISCGRQYSAVDASVNSQKELMPSTTAIEIMTATVPKAPPLHQNILIIGDSTAGFASWKVDKVKQPNETLVIHYKPGSPISYWNNGHFADSLNHSPKIDVALIFLGTVNFNFPYLPSVHHILNQVRARHIKCIWVGPTAVYGQKHALNTLLKKEVSSTCTYIDTEELDIPLVDGVHPTPDGTVKWLKEIWKVKNSL